MRRLVHASYDILAVGALFLLSVFFFQRAILNGEIFFERDTRVFYYPLHTWFAERLKQFEVPLWSPDYFGGFPILAEGESGIFYPPNALLAFFLPPGQAFIWNVVAHAFFAGSFTYCLCRALQLSRLAGVLGGTTFMFSGFLVGQIHHQNLFDSAVWLPLILCFIEFAARASGTHRYIYLAFAGAAYGFQSLAVHVQVPIMSSLVIGSYTVFRWLLCPIAGGRPTLFVRYDDWQRGWLVRPVREELDRLFAAGRVVIGRILLCGWTLLLVPLVGAGLAAIQLLPLFELGTFSRRAGGVAYDFATLHPQTPLNLITLLFPNFFKGPDGFYWGLWSAWETRIYVGLVPLVLAIVALIAVRSRFVYFFLALGVVAIWIGMASNAPFFNLHAFLSQFPGFNQMRAPGRYALVWSLAIAVLAAYGFSWLESHLRPGWQLVPGGPGPIIARWATAKQGWRPGLYAALGFLVIVAIEFALRLEEIGNQVLARSPEVVRWIEEYLTAPRMRRLPDEALTPDRVYSGLRAALDPASFSVSYTLVIIFLAIGILYLWLAFRPLRRLWQGLLLGLVIVDLVFVGWDFHPTTSIAGLDTPSPAVRFLQSRQATAPGRIYSRLGAATAPNTLAAFGLTEVAGYSSLNFTRHEEYTGALEAGYPHLHDAFSVRYVVAPARFVPLPSIEATPFNPTRPLLSTTSAQNGSAHASYTFDPFQTTEIRIVSRLRNSWAVPQGTPVIDLVMTDIAGRTTTHRLLAGVHTSEWAIDRPDVRAVARHNKGRVAFEFKNLAQEVEGYLYYAAFPLTSRTPIRKVEVRNVNPSGDVQVAGITMIDEVRGAPVLFKRLLVDNLDNWSRVYEDSDVVIYENTRMLPRAYLVPNALVRSFEKTSVDVLNFMAENAYDPRREVMFEVGDAPPLSNRPPVPTAPGEIRWEHEADSEIRLRVRSPIEQYLVLADSYYPGWKAFVNGTETPIYRANYLFRGIVVPPGENLVEFRFESPSFWLGFRITGATALALIAVWLLWRVGLAAVLSAQIARGLHRRGGHWRTLPLPPPLRRRPTLETV